MIPSPVVSYGRVVVCISDSVDLAAKEEVYSFMVDLPAAKGVLFWASISSFSRFVADEVPTVVIEVPIDVPDVSSKLDPNVLE